MLSLVANIIQVEEGKNFIEFWPKVPKASDTPISRYVSEKNLVMV
jgi:hypothetical protein